MRRLSASLGGRQGRLILAQYPLTAYVNADEALAAIQTDASFACTARLADQALSAYVPVFAYEFNDEHAPEFFCRRSAIRMGPPTDRNCNTCFRQRISRTCRARWSNFAAVSDRWRK